MNAVVVDSPVQPGTVSSSSLNQSIGRLYSAVIGGSAPIPPQQLVLVPVALLKQYDRMIRELEETSKRDRQMLSELLRQRDEMADPDARPLQLSPSAIAVVNSLLETVPGTSSYRDEVEEL